MIDALKYLLLIMSLAAFSVQAQNPFIARMEQAQVNEQEIPETIRKLRDKEKIEIRENLAVGPFHFRKKPIETEKQPFCVTCHLSRPHLENTRSRSFLNMHTRYVSCETCHLDPDEREVSYRWLAYDYPAAGELIDASMSVHTQVDRESTSIQVRPGAHIVPFLDDQPLLIFSDDPYALALADEWEQASLEQKARIKLRLHQPLEDKGRKCDDCHSETSSMLDFKSLGASERQAYAIERDKIADLFKRYRKDSDSIRIDDLLR